MLQRRVIPAPVMAVVAEVIASRESHASLDSLFMDAEAPGDPPEGSKHVKALEWLRRTNKEGSVDPMKVLGRLIENYMETADPFEPFSPETCRERISRILGQCELQYAKGGIIVGSLAAPSRRLEQLIRDRDLGSINAEFDRALRNIEINPREAVSAACNILEAVCKTYIEDEKLQMPSKQDLHPVWSVVRKDLGFDPAQVVDRDLQEILSGLIAIVAGIGALRTHASSAHGPGRKPYRLEPRHARLAVHSAHTVVLFVIEAWDKKRGID